MGCSNSKSVGEKTPKDLKKDVERTKKALEKAEKKHASAAANYRWAQYKYRDAYYDPYQDEQLAVYWKKEGKTLSKLVSCRQAHSAALKAVEIANRQ